MEHEGCVGSWSIAMRRIAIMLIGLIIAGAAAGDDAKPANRFAVQPSDDGFIRLDTQTGTVSHCGRRNGVWFCEKLVEDQTAIGQEIDALRARVDALAKQVEALATRAATTPPPAQVVASPDFLTKVIHRLYALVRRMKGEAGS
jgi:hypothetical protein